MSIRFFSAFKAVIKIVIPALAFGLLPLCAQTQVIPQVADGAGWSTTIVVANKTASSQTVSLAFHQAIGGGATSAWTPPFLESVNINGFSLAAGSTVLLHTPGLANSLIQGWGALNAPSGVVGYAIFTANSGGPAQDATAPAVTAASRILVPFDNTTGLVSALAVVNPNGSAETIQVNIKTSDGSVSTGTLPSLPGNGQTTFLMPTQFAQTNGKSGLAEFYVNSGTLSIIALRANGNALTSAPVYSQTGAPVVGASNTSQTPSTQFQTIPQVADGNGWATTIVLTNTTTGDLPVTLSFRMATAGVAGTTAAWNPPLKESVSLAGFILSAGSTIFLHTPGSAQGLTQGWAQLVADPRIVGYAIFTDRVSVSQAQDATAPAVSATTRILVPFDNTTGLLTAIAAVNPNGTDESMSINIRTADGTASTGTAITLPAQGQLTFLVPAQFSQTVGKSGLAEFFVSSGSISFIALRASGSAFTSAPTYLETGTPIITVSGGGGTGGGGTGGGGTGGSTSGTSPTQSEIDTWVSRGSYNLGTINLDRNTAYVADATGSAFTINKTDVVGGAFQRIGGADLGKVLRGQVPPDYQTLTPGACTVYKINSIAANPYPNLTTVSLDAGPQFTANGPNGTQIALKKISQGSVIGYNATGVPNTYLATGHYAIAGPGGNDVGQFSGSFDIVQDLVVTNPDELKSTINRGNGVTVRWTGGESSALLTITGSSASLNVQTGGIDGAVFVCLQSESAGQFTVPASVLSQLPASTSIAGFSIPGTFSVNAPGKGARFTAPSGLDILIGNNSWNWTFGPKYQ